MSDMAGAVVDLPEHLARRRDRHVERRTIVLEEYKLLYLPVPKTAWTSMLWLMAHMAGIPRERFDRAEDAETTVPMTVHDRHIWRESGRRLADYTGEARERVLNEDGWLRFAVVRDPATRLWSSWQSKLLRREPHYSRRFRERPWFPAIPESPDDVLRDFHAFVAALDREWWDDSLGEPHWMPQRDILSRLQLNHVGRMEQLDDTLNALRAHLGTAATVPDDLPRENRMPLPYSPVVYDEAAADVIRRRYGPDFEQYGYAPVDAVDDADLRAAWHSRADAGLPAVRAVIETHERLALLDEVVRERRRELRASAKRLKRAEAERDKKSKRVATLEKKVATLEKRAATLEKKTVAASRERDEARTRLAAVLRSRSWRMTRPVRLVGGAAKSVWSRGRARLTGRRPA